MTTVEKTVLDAPNYYVTEHFMHSDFICPCCDTIRIVPAFYTHAGLLEWLRREAGFPIVITSGYRCKSHNATVGGGARSWHLLFATDIQPMDKDPEQLQRLFQLAQNIGFRGIGRYETFLHLDLRPEQLLWRG